MKEEKLTPKLNKNHIIRLDNMNMILDFINHGLLINKFPE